MAQEDIIAAIKTSIDVCVIFNQTDLLKIYQEALQEAGIQYESKYKCWAS